jgi:hypothetical protein
MPETLMTAERLKDAGRKNMRYGALWGVLGAALLTLNYLVATAGVGSGRYIVAWGVILVGGFRFIRGMIQCARR